MDFLELELFKLQKMGFKYDILKEYNLLPAVYDSVREKIRLNKGVNWSDLCRIVS